jgi:hypothetical protein
VAKTHLFTLEEKLELGAIITMLKESSNLYELSKDTLGQAVEAAERGDLLQCNNLRVQSLNCELRALDIKIKALDRYQGFLEGVARVEGWKVRKGASNARTG